jgi:hypothetical protein
VAAKVAEDRVVEIAPVEIVRKDAVVRKVDVKGAEAIGVTTGAAAIEIVAASKGRLKSTSRN